MAQIAVAIGVSRATLYRHVRSREELLGALRTQALSIDGARARPG
jgi:AcrR family transcriptional regulator